MKPDREGPGLIYRTVGCGTGFPESIGAPWRTPANLLDNLESACKQGDADVALVLIIPELRDVLREAGLDIPCHGPHGVYWEEHVATQRRTEAQAKDARTTALYRWWDEADVLLYIGIAEHIGTRTKGHAKGSSWMEFAVRSAVERVPSRSGALEAEEAAIKAEHPIFNEQHNNTPEARRRQIEYLIEHDRLDLLAPAISRG